MNPLSAWLGQVTTGHGVTILLPTVMAVLSGQMTWQNAVPLVVGGVVLLLWPENSKAQGAAEQLTADAVKAAPALVNDAEALLAAYQTGVAHGAAGAKPAPAAAPANAA